ncbi:hypothetical protein ACFLSJ_02010 [Verrucomicrobiota bacterium]
MRKHRTIFNNDGSFVLGNGIHGGRELTPADAKDCVDLVAGTPVTSYFICTNFAMPFYPSRFERYAGSLDGVDSENGVSDENLSPRATCHMQHGRQISALAREGTDIVGLCVERSHAHGLEAFASFRVNDLHQTDPAIDNPFEQGDFWRSHPECYVGGESQGWNSRGALNFACDAVREYKLNMIGEICERFGIDGLELDFMRFPVFFPSGEYEKNMPLMTGFVRDVRAITESVGKKRGRPMALCVRLPATPGMCSRKALDVKTYVADGLIDFISLAAFFRDHPSLPVRALREELGNNAIPVYACLDHAIVHPGTHGDYRARAANRWREGADGIYLFNFFFGSEGKLFCKADVSDAARKEVRTGPSRELLAELADAGSLLGRNKLYHAGVNKFQFGTDLPYDLPAVLPPGTVGKIDIELAEPAGCRPVRTVLFLRMASVSKNDAPDVTWNDATVDPCTDRELPAAYGQMQMLQEGQLVKAWELPRGSLRDGVNTATIKGLPDRSCEISRAAVAVRYGAPSECGYF